MQVNRSMPPQGVPRSRVGLPIGAEAVDWLVAAFGFSRRWQAGDRRAQLGVGHDAAVAGAIVAGHGPTAVDQVADHMMVRVVDVDVHRERARAAEAVVREVGDYPYGERQYTATDTTGRRWVFSQSIADVAPSDWGATAG